jgi:OFA family oxalate/formate antiporter-like MFS transporter
VSRWAIAAAAVFMQVCLGVIYAWAVFRGPLEQAYGWDKSQSIAPFSWANASFTLAMIAAGFLQDRFGPRVIGSIGGVLLAAGCLLASRIGNTPDGLKLAYGVVAGIGVGFAYVTPIATCVKWFPDKRGFVVGLAVMGFGVGPLVFGPLLEYLLGKDPAAYATTLPATFQLLGLVFLICVTGAAQAYRVPPKGWKPEGWNPPSTANAAASYRPAQMLGTWQFYVLWVVYFLGSSIGLTAIGEAAPLVRELAGKAAIMTGGVALGIMSIFNGGGRLAWGALSDRHGRRAAMLGMAAISLVACGLILPGTDSFWRVLAGLCCVGFCYGGYLALMPSLTADYYGSANIGANYGLLFTAWGAAGFLLPRWSSSVVQAAKSAGQVGAGYNQVFYTLAGLAVLGGALASLTRRPPR